ncbi:MAG TPA: tripartite tricarboxylate transporter substrate binding protein [Reyranella sp.]|nr:tripartite tricarboxylate transporter substrate binding protein [Reyranella sp.]
MTITRRTALAGLAATTLAGVAHAESWPEKPITWILPNAPGGPIDAFARPVAEHCAEALGQPVIIDNRSGAGGTIAWAAAARAAPDGYTMTIGATGITYAPLIYPGATFDVARDFEPIAALARIQQVLAVNPQRIAANSLKQFIDYARSDPGAIDIGSPGLGTVPHLAIEMLQGRAGIKLHHVPYRNGSQMLQDLLSGQIAAMFGSVGSLAPYVRQGKLRVLGVAGRRREPQLPDIPTMDEAGLKDFRAISWFALFAPKQTPVAILDRAHKAVQKALGAANVKQIWQEQGARVELESRAEFSRFVTQEIVRWTAIAKAANVQLE